MGSTVTRIAVCGPLEVECVELLRPLLGVEASRGRLDAIPGHRDATVAVHRMRVELQLLALEAAWDDLDGPLAEARRLARSACAPVLGWIADWAEAMRVAATGRPADAVAAAQVASEGLAGFGERYTAARLLADLVPLLGPEQAGPLAADTAERLDAMGARASAAEVRAHAA